MRRVDRTKVSERAIEPRPDLPYSPPMSTALGFLIAAIMLATLGVLGFGIFGLFRGSDPRRANKLMQARIGFQLLALILILVFAALFRG